MLQFLHGALTNRVCYSFHDITPCNAKKEWCCRIGSFPKFVHMYGFFRDSLHWLPVTQRIQLKILTLMCNFRVGEAPLHLRTFCTSVSLLPIRSILFLAAKGLLVVARV